MPPLAAPPAPYPGGPAPYGGYPGVSPYGGGYPLPYPARVGLPRPTAIAPVEGTPFGVALVEVRATTSGPAAASLVAGVGSILVSFAVIFFASAGAEAGWGPAVAGAFAVLATVVGATAVVLASTALRRIRSSVAWGPIKGRGVAIAGLVCGVVGLAFTALTMLAALAT